MYPHLYVSGPLAEVEVVILYKSGDEFSGECIYNGHEILSYDERSRGERYINKLADKAEGVPQYMQFSDHCCISPNESDHYRLVWGDDREALKDEVIN